MNTAEKRSATPNLQPWQFGLQQLVVVPHFQQAGIGHVHHVGVSARLVDERPIPGQNDEVVGVVGKPLAQQFPPGALGQRPVLPRQ